MMLPRDLLSGNYTKPRLFLCETDKTKICQLDTANTRASLKFSSYSELSCEVGRVYNDLLTGEVKINPYFDKIEALRLIHLEGFGYFEIQGPGLNENGIEEKKAITAYSAEYALSTKYLEDFYINTGEVDSVEVIYADEYGTDLVPVTLYNPNNKALSLLHLALEKIYGWSIGHVDESLKTLSRQFEADRISVYDFLMNEVCEKFNCYIVWDTINNQINLYAESLTAKFIGDGTTSTFIISPPFEQVGTVSVDGYKTTKWSYSPTSGTLRLSDAPEYGAHVEVIDAAMTNWETDVFVSFDNLAQEVEVSYSADDIKTQLTITYGEDGTIRESNLGMPYIMDLSYYCTPDWMGQDLYDRYIEYQQMCNAAQGQYTDNSQKMVEIANRIRFEEERQSLQYAVADNVMSDTVGTYYVRGGTSPDYYYTEVSLPAEYKVQTTYYKEDGINVTEDSATDLYYAIEKVYLKDNDFTELSALITTSELKTFAFMDDKYSIASLVNDLKTTDSLTAKDVYVTKFLNIMWQQVGRTPLKEQYLEPFKQIQIALLDSGRSVATHEEYPSYYLVTVFLDSIEDAIARLDAIIAKFQAEYDKYNQENIEISDRLQMDEFFSPGQLIRLSAFVREDELHLEDIVQTSQDSIADTFKAQQDALETGRINLNKICQPQLQFSMTMANIYALPEFASIVNQFQLGNVIKVRLRSDAYIKQSRLLQVDINFEDFSDFSCEFGELTTNRTQSDIHADLLSQAVSAGKSVAQNSAYWTKGSDQATATNLKIQQGLLDALTQIKSIDGTQDIIIDKYGIKIQKKDPVTGEIDPHQAWFVNNRLLLTDDGWKTSRAGLGEFTVDGEEMYGLLADCVLAGYIEGSKIVGGTIQIGLQSDGTYAFEVHSDGRVTMGGGSSIAGYTTTDYVNGQITNVNNNINTQINNVNNNIDDQISDTNDYINDQISGVNNTTTTLSDQLQSLQNTTINLSSQLQTVAGTSTIISGTTPANASEGQIWINTAVVPYALMVYTKGQWIYLEQQDGVKVFASQPASGTYSAGDIWILGNGEVYGSYGPGDILKANESLSWIDATPSLTETMYNVRQYFDFNTNTGLRIGQRDEKFHVNVSSTKMGFYDGDTEVVHISNKSANIDNLTVEKGLTVDSSSTFKGDMTITNASSGFIWKIESNGSLSLAVAQ